MATTMTATMGQKDSNSVTWSLVESDNIIVQSNDILDCIEARDNEQQKITDGIPQEQG